jgi:hypothetical protein
MYMHMNQDNIIVESCTSDRYKFTVSDFWALDPREIKGTRHICVPIVYSFGIGSSHFSRA